MLLRSITKHVKDQNWFAVFLDFFIVVAGILIAFQITNWNEDRALTKRTNKLVERLETDFELRQTHMMYANWRRSIAMQIKEIRILLDAEITGEDTK